MEIILAGSENENHCFKNKGLSPIDKTVARVL
jgi:hypothetical protein